MQGWKNKDAKVTDQMKLEELNLPLDNNLFVINTNEKAGVSSSHYEETNSKIDSFELSIKVIKNQSSGQIKIVNQSKSAEAAELAAHLLTETFKTDSEPKTSEY